MNFILTRYIYPLENKRLLSDKLNICLDNPRTEEEIETVAEYLRYSQSAKHAEYGHHGRLPLDSEVKGKYDVLTIEQVLHDFFRHYSSTDAFVKKLHEQSREEDVFRTLAKMWIVARYDDEGQIQALREESTQLVEEGQLSFIMLEDEHPIVKNSRILVNYSYLLSLLIHTEGLDYFGKSFILHHHENTIREPRVDRGLNYQLMFFGVFVASDSRRQDPMDWLFYPFIERKLHRVAKEVDTVLDDVSKGKILYVANLLKVAGKDVHDERIRLTVLVSIIELLLTHSPDFNRFNVEESISRQFRLKTSILVYLNDRTRNLEAIRNRLRVIYNQRSNIAHGNFKTLDKYIQRLSKKEGEEEYFGDLIADLYDYVRAIMQEYIRDREFVEFLKAN